MVQTPHCPSQLSEDDILNEVLVPLPVRPEPALILPVGRTSTADNLRFAGNQYSSVIAVTEQSVTQQAQFGLTKIVPTNVRLLDI